MQFLLVGLSAFKAVPQFTSLIGGRRTGLQALRFIWQ
jgi:hypothetical protein